MKEILVDIETYSEVDIGKCGLYRYATDPSFEILLIAWATDEGNGFGETRCADLASGEVIPDELLEAFQTGSVRLIAHNAAFERVCFSVHLNRHYPGQYLKPGDFLSPDSWICTMVMAASLTLPLALKDVGTVLKTSQPAVTRTIHKLENELGCRLFTRSKTGMQLTPEGRTFYGYVAAGCAQFFKGENDLSNLISLENGTIYISATETALHCYLFQAMEEFNSLYPNVRFKILNNSTTESVNAVKEGKVDLAFVSANLQVAKPLRMKILRKYHDILISGNRFGELKDDGKEVSLKELVSYPWISLTAETITRRFLNEYFEKNSLTFTPDMELATTDMILPAVRHNLGLGFIPAEFADSELKSGQVFEIKVKEKLPERNIILIYDKEYPQSIAAKEFQKFLKEKEM